MLSDYESVTLTYNVERQSCIPTDILADDPETVNPGVLAERAEDSFWSSWCEHLDNDPWPTQEDINVVRIDLPGGETPAESLTRGIGHAAGRKLSIMAIEDEIEQQGLTKLERYELALSILGDLNREAPLAWSKQPSRGDSNE